MWRKIMSRRNGPALPAIAAGAAFTILATASAAAGPYEAGDAYHRHDETRWERSVDYRRHTHRHRHIHKHRHAHRRAAIVKPRHRYEGAWVHRRHEYRHRDYPHYHGNAHTYRWREFTATTSVEFDRLSETQQWRHESARMSATTAPVGETIHWKDDTASGSVRVVREGTSSSGRYCREFRQKIRIGGRIEDAYGTACQQPDGAWEILP